MNFKLIIFEILLVKILCAETGSFKISKKYYNLIEI